MKSDIGKTDLHLGAPDADCSNEQSHSGLLIGEHMLDAGADYSLPALARQIGADFPDEAVFCGEPSRQSCFLSMKVTFAVERYAVSAQTVDLVLQRSNRSSRRLAPSCALVLVVRLVEC